MSNIPDISGQNPNGASPPPAAVPSANLIQKYAVAGPRYTSYPTAVEFSPKFGAADWSELLKAEFSSGVQNGLSLYMHLPFCRSLCYFCACNKVITQDRSVVKPYVDALVREFELYSGLFEKFGLELPAAGQLHWGGGTPNYLTSDEMSLIFSAAVGRFKLAPGADISIEVDPRTTAEDQIQTLAGLGFTRISLGVQDFDPDVQAAINRVRSIECTEQVIDWSRAAGMSSVNIDLIYGLPLQTPAGFGATIERILTIRPERIALYGYAHVTWLTKVQRSLEREHLPSPAERIALFLQAVEQLTSAGYVHIGMDHFALPTDGLGRARANGTLNRNFMGYSTNRGSKILGFGTSSISTLDGGYAQNNKDINSYQAQTMAGNLPIERGLATTADDRLRAEVIQGVLCGGVVEIAAIENTAGIDFFTYFSDSISGLTDLAADGLVEFDRSKITVTPLGRYFQRNIAMVFDAYLKRHLAEEKRVFSQAV